MQACRICHHTYHDRPGRGVCPFDGGELVPVRDPLLGRVVGGRYRVEEKLGQGGFGAVYRAAHDTVGRSVALKFLLPEHARDPKNRERFLREARAANRIDHEHIIDITDFGETEDGLVYLVMELLEGCSLADEIAKAPLGVARSVDIALQCASALARAHELGVIHRDIKPDNIYLVAVGLQRDHAKLLDFGLAQMKGELRLTATGAVFGTPEYMAPEQARGSSVSGATDLYSLGCVLFDMLAGEPPFRGSTADLILQHMREKAPRVSTRAKDVPAELDDLVAMLLEKDPQKRFRDGYHLVSELRKVEGALPRLKISIPAPDERRERRRSQIDDRSTHAPSWRKRLRIFRALADEAHPSAIPDWLSSALVSLERSVDQLDELEHELQRNDAAAVAAESELRSTRLRIGRAIDELGRDESIASGRIAAAQSELAALQTNHTSLEMSVVSALSQLRHPGVGETVSATLANLMIDAGRAAGAWLDGETRLTAIHGELRQHERVREDLRFQIAQLKGRLGSVGIELELQAGALRDASARVGRMRQETVEGVTSLALKVSTHLRGFPKLDARWAELEASLR